MSKQKNIIYNSFKDSNLSHRSKLLYVNRLLKLDPSGGESGINYFTNTSNILNKIKNESLTTKKTSLAAVLSLFKFQKKQTKKILEAMKIYRDELSKINEEISSKSNLISEKKKENWVSKEDIVKKQRLYKRRFNKITKKDYKDITDNEYKTVLEYVILSLYTLNVPRRDRDYYLMYINSDNHNSFDINNKVFIFRDYKDMKALGTQIIPVNRELYNILKIYTDILRERFWDKDNGKLEIDNLKLLVKSNGKYIGAGDIRLILTDIFGKNVGPNSLRRSFATEELKPMIDKIHNASKHMGTSVEMVKSNYVTENAPKD